VADIDEAMAKAVDIGENEDEEDSDTDAEVVVGEEEVEAKAKAEGDEEEEEEEDESKMSRNWSVLKSTPQLRKSKPKPKKEGPMTLDEAVGDSANLTDFLLDFEEEEEE
ncbi:plastid transcriptionally active protein 12, partial [Trifolium pratense]